MNNAALLAKLMFWTSSNAGPIPNEKKLNGWWQSQPIDVRVYYVNKASMINKAMEEMDQ